MKNYFFILLVLFVSVSLNAQSTLKRDGVVAKSWFEIQGNRVDSICIDSTLTGATDAQLISALAVKEYSTKISTRQIDITSGLWFDGGTSGAYFEVSPSTNRVVIGDHIEDQLGIGIEIDNGGDSDIRIGDISNGLNVGELYISDTNYELTSNAGDIDVNAYAEIKLYAANGIHAFDEFFTYTAVNFDAYGVGTYEDNDDTYVLTVDGSGDVQEMTFPDLKRLDVYTVATLPASPTAGDMAYVTDATAPTYLGTLTGGGAVVCPVFYNGSAWVSH